MRTATGKLRATQTARIKGGGGKVRKPIGGGGKASAPAPSSRQAGATLPQPVRVRGNFRPRSVMARPVKGENPYVAGNADLRFQIGPTNDDKAARLANAQIAKTWFERQGLKVRYSSSRNSNSVASYNPATKETSINRSHTHWVNPAKAARENRTRGFYSSSAPMNVLYHELGHARDKGLLNRSVPFGNLWILSTRQGNSQEQRAKRGAEMSRIARRVSIYGSQSPSEFIAETYAGRRTGRLYDHQVMRAYREARGLPGIRTGSRVAPGASPLASPGAVARDRARRRRKPR